MLRFPFGEQVLACSAAPQSGHSALLERHCNGPGEQAVVTILSSNSSMTAARGASLRRASRPVICCGSRCVFQIAPSFSPS